MSGRIERRFAALREDGRSGLVTFTMMGDPDIETSFEILRGLPAAGADIIEIGSPFTDPMADGPVIQVAGQRALKAGITLEKTIALVRRFRETDGETPLILMGYYNQIIAMGHKNYCALSSEAGVDGLIVADLPASEANELIEVCKSKKLAFVPLLALTSTEESISEACKLGTGFIYCISVLGVTGVREQMNQRVEQLVGKVRQYTDLPIAVGFGVSKPNHIQELRRYADGAVIGSALINAIGTGSNTEVTNRAHNFIRSLDSNITD